MTLSFQPMPLSRRPHPFNHPEWLFELKYDGFRALARIERGRAPLISRNGHPFTSFSDLADSIAGSLPTTDAIVLDGEIVCLDRKGYPQFNDLLFRRGKPCFYAFDLLYSDGKDWRRDSLVDRKVALRAMLQRQPTNSVRYADHVERSGIALFERVCQLDLEGIIAKYKFGPYGADGNALGTWYKIRNRHYSQMVGRNELFERDRHKEPVPGWHTCELACADAA